MIISPSGPNSTNETISQPFTMKRFATIDPYSKSLPPNVPLQDSNGSLA